MERDDPFRKIRFFSKKTKIRKKGALPDPEAQQKSHPERWL
jgi:hypothetical protein